MASKATNKYRIITVLNYDDIQIRASKTAVKGQAKGKQRATNKKNNKEINIVEQSPTDYSAEIEVIINYLNEKLGTKYRAQTVSTRKHIIARLKEGYSVDDFKRVIDSKYSDWSGDSKMSRYLRPDTLFGSKFENYFNSAASNEGSSDLDALIRGYNR